MLKVGDFLKYLIASEANSAFLRSFTLAFQHGQSADEFLTADMINHFVRQALHYTHWQQQRATLTAELQDWLSPLWSEELISFSPNDIQWPDELQVFEIENTAEWIESLQSFAKRSSAQGAEVRIVQDVQGMALGMILLPTGELQVHQWNRQMTIRRGQLEPLRKDLVLHYTADLELSSLHLQRFEIAPYSVATFSLTADILNGAIFRGHSFQLQASFVEARLEQIPNLFWSLKRTEQHFISRESDPFYQNLLAHMEAANLSIRIGEAGSTEKAVDAMASAQNALENVFLGDKLLALLIRDLQHTLELHQSDVRSRREATQRVSVNRARDSVSSQAQASHEQESAPIIHRTRPYELES